MTGLFAVRKYDGSPTRSTSSSPTRQAGKLAERRRSSTPTTPTIAEFTRHVERLPPLRQRAGRRGVRRRGPRRAGGEPAVGPHGVRPELRRERRVLRPRRAADGAGRHRQPEPGPAPRPKRLGFRVPAIAIGPFAPKKIEHGRPLRALLDPEDDRVALGARADDDARRNARNLAEALDFTTTREPARLPAFPAPDPPGGLPESAGRARLTGDPSPRPSTRPARRSATLGRCHRTWTRR